MEQRIFFMYYKKFATTNVDQEHFKQLHSIASSRCQRVENAILKTNLGHIFNLRNTFSHQL